MPQVLDLLDATAIIEVLRQRGWGIDSCPGFEFRLAVRSKTDVSKTTGLGFWEPIGGVTTQQMMEIRRTSRDVYHAVDRVESISTGKTHDVTETDDRMGGAQIKMEAVLHAVDNRIDAKLDPIRDALAAISKVIGAGPIAVAPDPTPVRQEEPDLTPPPVEDEPPQTDAADDFSDLDGLEDISKIDPKAAPVPTPRKKARKKRKVHRKS